MLNLEKNFLKKRILIYGLGKSGLSTYSYLKKTNIISLYDDRIITKKNIKDNNLFYNIHNFYMNDSISRSSETMANCTHEILNKAKVS